ncbi:MAG: hypothetical protein JRD89_16245, partial [Deltaproteobacteria bacterium]|nr:hypothetical protein [Deltaproteobacteria bacterium]
MEVDVEEKKLSRRRFLVGLLWLVPAVTVGATVWRLTRPPRPKLKPAELHVYGLTVEPSEVEVGEQVQVSVGVVNIGDLEDTFTVTLKVDGAVVDVKEVTLAGGDTTFVTFQLTGDVEGTHEVEVNGLTETFNVVRPAPPTPVIPPELKEKFLRLLPEAAEFKAVVKDEKVIYYEAYDETGSLIGYVFITKAYGPSDRLEVVGIVDLDYKVAAIDVEPLPEHPHLFNQKIREQEFEDQFTGLSVKELHPSPEG